MFAELASITPAEHSLDSVMDNDGELAKPTLLLEDEVEVEPERSSIGPRAS